jgi:hypothetical protein
MVNVFKQHAINNTTFTIFLEDLRAVNGVDAHTQKRAYSWDLHVIPIFASKSLAVVAVHS